MRKAWLMCCVLGMAPTAHAQELSFSDAIDRAAADGPTITAHSAAVDAARLSVRPAGALPDPQLVVALDNVPVTGIDRFRLNRDEMTMERVGVMQEMPSGLGQRRAVAEAEAERARAALGVARLDARLGAADAWIALYYAQRRQDAINRMAVEAHASAQAARGRLSGGSGGVDGAIAAEVDAARVEDRRADLQAKVVQARAELRRWIGDAADESLAQLAPAFTVDAVHLRHHLDAHPALAAVDAEADVAQANVALARAARRPDWSWELSYGRRDPAFGDMASVEVRVGLPLFQGGRQQPLIDARQADVQRARADRDATEREHAAMLEAQLAEYGAITANLARARDVRLPLMQRAAAAATAAFSAGSGATTQLIEARRGALEAELDLIDLEERQTRLGAELTLQYAESAP